MQHMYLNSYDSGVEVPWPFIEACSLTITNAKATSKNTTLVSYGKGKECGTGKLVGRRNLNDKTDVEYVNYDVPVRGSGAAEQRKYYFVFDTDWEATTYAYQGSITINYVPKTQPGFDGDFDILPDSTLTYGDAFKLHPRDIETTGSCTFQSIKFRIERNGQVYTGNVIINKTTDDTYTLAKYPYVMLAGASHEVYMQINTSCGSDWVGPKELYLMDPDLGGGGSTPPPTSTPPPPGENRPPTAKIAWVKAGATTPTGMIPVGTKVDLLITDFNDPDYPDDWVDVDHWDFASSTDWLKTVPDGFGGNLKQNSYTNIMASGIGSHQVALTVKDLKGATFTAYATLNVVDSKPVAVIRGPSSVKAGRPLPSEFDGLMSYSPIGLKIVDYVWTNIQTKYMTPGTETITLKVKDEENHWSDVASKPLNVIPDEPPIDTLAVPEQGTRLGIVTIVSGAYSPDYDNLVSHKIEMKYDANNDGFANDAWQTVVNGNGDADSFTFTPSRIGKYLFQETVCEDYGLCGNTSGQPEAARTLDVKNIAPIADVKTESDVSDPPESSAMLMTDLYNNGRFYNISSGAVGDKSNWKIDTGGILTSKSRTPLTNNTRPYYGTYNSTILSTSFGIDGVPRMSAFTGIQSSPTLTRIYYPDNPIIVPLDDDKYTYIGAMGSISAYTKSMQLVWKRDIFKGYPFQLLSYGSTVVAVGESGIGRSMVIGFNRDTGQELFRNDTLAAYVGGYTNLLQIPNGFMYGSFKFNASGEDAGQLHYPYVDGVSQKYGVMMATDNNSGTSYMMRTSDQGIIGSHNPGMWSPSYRYYLGSDNANNLYALVQGQEGWTNTVKIGKFNLGSSSFTYSPALDLNSIINFLGMDNKQRLYENTTVGYPDPKVAVNVLDASGNFIKQLVLFPWVSPKGGGYQNYFTQMIVGADGTLNFFGYHLDTENYLDNYATVSYASYDTDLNLITSGSVGQILVGKDRMVTFSPRGDQSFLIVSKGGYTTDPYFLYTLTSNGTATKPKIIDVGEATPDLITGQQVAGDKTLKTSLKEDAPDGKGAGIAHRIRDDRNYYSVEFEANELRVKKTVNGTATVVWNKGYPMVANQVYDIKIVPRVNAFDVYVNRVYQTTISESAWLDGKFGIVNRGQANVSFLASSIETTPAGYGKIEGIALVGQQVNYTLSYSDEESDPQLTAGSSWVYAHNPNALLQPQGTAAFNGQTLSSPVTSFPFAGDYTFTYKTKDDPHPSHRYPDSAFNAYRQESNVVTGKIRVHRRPIADFTASWNSNGTIGYTDASYDPDRYNPANGSYSTENTGINYQATRGVLEYRYRYRAAGSSTYIELKPARLFGGTYIIELSVRDEYNAWSEWATQTIVAGGTTPLPPNPGFTIAPTTQYRFTALTINSTASDPQDGARENVEHAYYIKNLTTGGPESLQSDARTSWTKEFSSLGVFQVRQVVINSFGLYAEIAHNVSIVNRKPVADITEPASTSAAAPTMYDTQRPTMKWTYSDGDDDPQKQYQLHFYKSDGSFYRDSGAVVGSDLAWTPSADFADNTTYYAYVRVSDGTDWSNWSAPHYFRIVTNKPPTADLAWTPSPVWEGDTVKLLPTMSDPDGDRLDAVYEIESPAGAKRTVSEQRMPPYGGAGPTFVADTPGNWKVRLTVGDGKAPAVSVAKTIAVGPLGVTGRVLHTAAWEDNRQRYNAAHRGKERPANWFWAGELFVLEAATTDTGASDTKAATVTAEAGPRLKAALQAVLPGKPAAWKGELGSEQYGGPLKELPEGDYTFVFTAAYTNGVVKKSTVVIRVSDTVDGFANVHRVQ
ncbi:hypothetical protein SAMN05216312_102359 [Cohnella sp. OV330]|nr:hypothetical protein SAMN05216312_102359 [Cohnella sp. OV330]